MHPGEKKGLTTTVGVIETHSPFAPSNERTWLGWRLFCYRCRRGRAAGPGKVCRRALRPGPPAAGRRASWTLGLLVGGQSGPVPCCLCCGQGRCHSCGHRGLGTVVALAYTDPRASRRAPLPAAQFSRATTDGTRHRSVLLLVDGPRGRTFGGCNTDAYDCHISPPTHTLTQRERETMKTAMQSNPVVH